VKVIDVDWTPKGNVLKLACDCGEIFSHPSWKRWAKCSKCGAKGDLIELKGEDEKRAVDVRGL